MQQIARRFCTSQHLFRQTDAENLFEAGNELHSAEAVQAQVFSSELSSVT